jgi:hypothetical protein
MDVSKKMSQENILNKRKRSFFTVIQAALFDVPERLAVIG